MTYYLYKKTHQITGLKYLGKTAKVDPHQYQGSGKRWRSHLKKHGYHVDTEILKECQTNDEVKYWGEYYSKLWNIVDSDDWANLKEETGDGGNTSLTDAFKAKIPLMSELAKNRKWWNNGEESVHSESQPGPEWVRGRIMPTDNVHNTGKKYWNNGVKNVMSDCCPGPEWYPGMVTTEEKMWTDGVTNKRAVEAPGPEWRLGFTKTWDGHLPSSTGLKWWINGTEKMYCTECPGYGWVQGRGSWWTDGTENKLCSHQPGPTWRRGRTIKS